MEPLWGNGRGGPRRRCPQRWEPPLVVEWLSWGGHQKGRDRSIPRARVAVTTAPEFSCSLAPRSPGWTPSGFLCARRVRGMSSSRVRTAVCMCARHVRCMSFFLSKRLACLSTRPSEECKKSQHATNVPSRSLHGAITALPNASSAGFQQASQKPQRQLAVAFDRAHHASIEWRSVHEALARELYRLDRDRRRGGVAASCARRWREPWERPDRAMCLERVGSRSSRDRAQTVCGTNSGLCTRTH